MELLLYFCTGVNLQEISTSLYFMKKKIYFWRILIVSCQLFPYSIGGEKSFSSQYVFFFFFTVSGRCVKLTSVDEILQLYIRCGLDSL